MNDGPWRKCCASRLACSWPAAARPSKSRFCSSTACRSLVANRRAPGSCAPLVTWLVFGNSKVAVRRLCSWYKRLTINSLKALIPRISGTPKPCWPNWSYRIPRIALEVAIADFAKLAEGLRNAGVFGVQSFRRVTKRPIVMSGLSLLCLRLRTCKLRPGTSHSCQGSG